MIKLKKEEKIELIKRRHLAIFILQLLPLLLLSLATLFALFYVLFAFPSSWQEFLNKHVTEFLEFSPKYLILFLLSCFLLIFWQIIFFIIVHYFLDTWIITNKRSIHFELVGLFRRKYASIDHDKIQDITIKMYGVLPTLFKYGNLRIQTAGAFKEFICKQIPDPVGTKEIINKVKKVESK